MEKSHIKNLLRQIKEELQENKPVIAAYILADLKKYLEDNYIIEEDKDA